MVGDPSRPSGLGGTIPTTDERWRHILHSGQRGVSRTTNRDGGTAEARRGRREAEVSDGQILDRPSWNNRYHESDRLRRRRICVRTPPTFQLTFGGPSRPLAQ